jgi:hypothetical protein
MKLVSAFRAMGAAFALVCLGFLAHATVGVPPIPATGPGLVDGTWLNGLAGGSNFAYQSGITAHAGGTQAAAFQLLPGVALFQISTVATTGDSVALPECVQGTWLMIANAGTGTLDVYGSPITNGASGTLDTINATAGTSAYTLATNTNAIFFCPKNGAWAAGKIS